MPQLRPRTLIDKVRAAQSIQLDIPPDTPAAKFWTPHQHTPSIAMSRVRDVDASNDLPKVSADGIPSSPDLTIVLTERIGTKNDNRVDIYYASVQGIDGLVVRIMDLSFYPPARRPWFANIFADDFHAYNTVLAPLQGTVVPRFGGMFARELLYCMVHEDAGRLLTVDERWNRRIQDDIIAAVATTHKAGIATNLTNWTGICLDSDGQIKLTDFRHASTLRRFTPEYLQAMEDEDEDYAGLTPEMCLASGCNVGMEDTLHLLGRSEDPPP